MEPVRTRINSPALPLLQPSPIRILVQTLTHLVPSDGVIGNGEPYGDKLLSMLHRICRHHWNCDFKPGVQRWYAYGNEFGYNNRVCFFLVDHGTASNDDDVPILSYEWTGETFKPKPEILQSNEIREKLKEFPFTGVPRKREKPPIREIVRSRLRNAEYITTKELEYMREHPEDMEWLQRKVRPRFWSNFLKQMESVSKDENTEGKE